MTQEEIKSICETQYAQIQDAEFVLKRMRELCEHPNTFEGKYSWRVGNIDDATICSDCGKVVATWWTKQQKAEVCDATEVKFENKS